MSRVTVSRSETRHRWEAHLDGELAGFAQYRVRDDVVVFTHTEVDDRFEGHGVGAALARFALDEVRQDGMHARPDCPFIRSWIDRHPDYADLVV